ncbi:unnamed protein product, partial [Adineta steineri]
MSLGSLYKILHNNAVEILWSERLSIALQAAKGINYLHQYKPQILHRDIKSPNFLLGKSHEGYLIKVCDFGLAKTRSETTRQTTDKTRVAFTLPWTAPEILRCERYTDKSDIYSLGIVYWELATREIPYDDYASDQITQNVRDGQRLPINEIKPSNFDTIIKKCWEHNQANRPDSTHLIEIIKNCIQNEDFIQLTHPAISAPAVSTNVTTSHQPSSRPHPQPKAATSTTTTTGVIKLEGKNNSSKSQTSTTPSASSGYLSTIYNWFFANS